MPLVHGPAIALQLPRLPLELCKALLRKRLQGPVDDQIDELLGREEAAAVLAGVAVGTDYYPAVVVPDRLPFQQPFV